MNSGREEHARKCGAYVFAFEECRDLYEKLYSFGKVLEQILLEDSGLKNVPMQATEALTRCAKEVVHKTLVLYSRKAAYNTLGRHFDEAIVHYNTALEGERENDYCKEVYHKQTRDMWLIIAQSTAMGQCIILRRKTTRSQFLRPW
jgi:hypothetical protein